MKHFYVVSNAAKDENFVLRNRVCAYLTERGALCQLQEEEGKPSPETECVITLGGDGTLLRTSRIRPQAAPSAKTYSFVRAISATFGPFAKNKL